MEITKITMRFNKHILFFGSFTLFIIFSFGFKAQAQQGNNAEAFQKALHFADSVYALKDYESAKAAYQYADRLQSGNAHIAQRMATIDAKIAETDALNKKYNLALSEARQAINEADLPKAKERLEFALTLKPKETWPKEKLAEVNKTMADQAELQRQFDEHIAHGDNFFNTAKYPDAKTEFEAALKLIPANATAKEKLAAVKTKMQDIETEYKNKIASADKLYQDNDLEGAKAAYQEALVIKPNQPYPQQKIQQIDNIIYEEGVIAAELDVVVRAADQAFDRQDYTTATQKYKEALDILSSHQHSKDRLAEIVRLIGDNEAKMLAYNACIEKANNHYNQKRYPEAKNEYQNALNIFPDEKLPQERIAEIDRILSQQLAAAENLEQAIAAADAAFDASQWISAKEKYGIVLQINPGNTYATQRIKTIEATLAQIDKDYNALISKADGLFNTKKYSDALTNYTEASGIKPDEAYPKTKIVEINNLLNDRVALQERYDALIAEADAAFDVKDWEKAIEKYTAAIEVKPAENYPKQQLAKANKEFQSAADIEKRYNDAIVRADLLFNDQQWNESITAYQAALKVKPDETYPASQINLAKAKLGDLAQLESSYKAAIADGDAQFKAKNWTEAIAKYQEALTLKPTENYPTVQIDKANRELEAIAAENASYNKALQTADSLFAQSSWNESITAYQSALRIKPSESYPQSQIDKAQSYLSDQAKLASDYSSAIAAGDKLFNTKKWSESIVEYRKALTLKPEEQYPQDQIAKATETLKALEDKETAYNEAIAQGDQFFNNKNYAEAKTSYQTALSIKIGEKYPTDKIAEITKIEGINAQYDELIANADGLFNNQQWTESVTAYQAALKVKPDETYPQTQIEMAKAKLGDLAQLESSYKAAIAEGDALFKTKNWNESIGKYQEALTLKPGETYPQQQIDKANAELATIAATDASYTSALQNADDLFSQEKWAESITAYQAALKIKPAETYPKEQIDKANLEIKALADKETAYNNKIAEGDKLFKAGTWMDAKAAYQSALEIKAGEAYPQTQIGLCDEQLRIAQEKLEAEQALEANYQNFLTQADQMFQTEKWEESMGFYNQALSIKPNEAYPKKQIELANKELEKIAATRKSYNDAITQADALFQQENWQEAKTAYTQASTLIPAETYPSQQIAAINQILEELARKQEQYNAAITQADAAFGQKEYESARNGYKEALQIKPDEKYPAQRLTEIENILDAEKAAENTRIYREKVAEANAFIAEKNLSSAISSLKVALEHKPNDDFATKKIAELQKTLDDAATAKSEYARLIAEGDAAFNAEKYREAITAYRGAMRFQPNEMYPRKKVSEAERNLEYTPERRRQLAQESLKRGEDALATSSYEAAMRAFGNAYYWYPENGAATQAQMQSIIKNIESGTEKDILEQPLVLTANRRGSIDMDIKPSELKGTTYLLFKVSGTYENNVNVFVRWGRAANESGAAVITLVYGLDDIYYCVEIKGAGNGLTWISVLPENTDLIIEDAKLMSK